ncbi:unnamed protein product [Oncorhynchus mykiss]|uniref:Anti-proliferative protein domain-containing protein n=1 Tax=Oncorhynchus mykiss TaxID=8022 RepID=A0A060Z4B3_ONCMY|nr:unnamed protein product [Oncorhynchus mykiss]
MSCTRQTTSYEFVLVVTRPWLGLHQFELIYSCPNVDEQQLRIWTIITAYQSNMMEKEIAAVVFFLKRLIKKVEKLETQKVDMFVERLTVALQENSGCIGTLTTPANDFRCIRLNRLQREDPELLRACQESGVQYKDLGLLRGSVLHIWREETCFQGGQFLW